MSNHRPTKCYWCRESFMREQMTKDHLIPSWAMKAIPLLRRRDDINCVPCCQRCNIHKGGMPAPAYSHVRLDVEKHKLVHRQWGMITQQFRDAWHHNDTGLEDAEAMATLILYVRAEMTAPMTPPYEWPQKPPAYVRPTHQSAPSWEQIVRGHDVRMQPPTSPVGPVNAPHSKNAPIKRVYRLDEKGKVVFDYVADDGA